MDQGDPIGHGYTKFRDFGFWAHDADLGLWGACLVREMCGREVPAWLQPEYGNWLGQATWEMTGIGQLSPPEDWSDGQLAFVSEVACAARDRLVREGSLELKDLDAACGAKVGAGRRPSRKFPWEPEREAARALWVANRLIWLLEETHLNSDSPGQDNAWLYHHGLAIPVAADLWRQGDRWGGAVTIQPRADDTRRPVRERAEQDDPNGTIAAIPPEQEIVTGAKVRLDWKPVANSSPPGWASCEATVRSVATGQPDRAGWEHWLDERLGPCVLLQLLGDEPIPYRWRISSLH